MEINSIKASESQEESSLILCSGLDEVAQVWGEKLAMYQVSHVY